MVGDTTIVANRSKYVDFTLPYTESGVSMIVPIKDNKSKSAWIFLKPLTWDLWVTSACFFVFIGFVIWVLEHRINEDFRGPHSHQAGTIFWFSFTTMMFAQSKFSSHKLASFAEMMLIFWFYVCRGENYEQLGAVCDDHMVLCGAHSYSKLHRQLDINVNCPTAPANRYRHKRAISERGVCRLPTRLFRSRIPEKDEV